MRIQATPRRKNIISLTPLIDIVFILLVFFMLTSSFTRQTSVDIQQSESGTESVAPVDYQVLTVTSAGVRLENDTVITFDNLANWANPLKSGNELMVLTADDSAIVQQLLNVLEILQPILGERVSLAVTKADVSEG